MQHPCLWQRRLCVNVGVSEDYASWVAAERVALLRFAWLVLGSRTAAEDAVQDALENALRHWDKVSASRDRSAYARRMVMNAHASSWRRTRRLVPVPEVRRSVPAGSDVELADLCWRACSTLPPKQRAAVVLRFYEDLDYPEIAAVLGCRESTARAGVHRGLAALRRVLEQEDWSDG